jgi:hypothetical protein
MASEPFMSEYQYYEPQAVDRRLAIQWMIVKGKLITKPAMAYLASNLLVVTSSCLSVLR